MTIIIRAKGVGDMRQISSVGDAHTCHKISLTTLHLGGAVMTGSGFMSIHGKPIARKGDTLHCLLVNDKIKHGVDGITINKRNIAVIGNHSEHGGVITEGASDAFVAELIDYSTSTD
jgi:uncharacterized Zn-binding protein involved in type VI secretion